jgi:hypothetical protein
VWLAGLGVLIAAVCITLRERINVIVAIVFLTIAASSAVLPATPMKSIAIGPAHAEASYASDLPLLIHIVLDGHIGLSNKNISSEVAKLYGANGFLLYPNAYSQFYNTFNSLSHLVNGSTRLNDSLVGSEGREWQSTDSAYFRALSGQGYKIHVSQNEHIDLCASVMDLLAQCMTYTYKDLSSLLDARAGLIERASFLLAAFYTSFAKNSTAHVKARFYYIRVRRILPLPEWPAPTSIATGPVAGIAALEDLRERLPSVRPGDAFFLHVLIPHAPFMYERDCQLAPLGEWRVTGDGTPVGDLIPAYLAQIECVNEVIAELLADLRSYELFERAFILIHGDHGSRLTELDLFGAEPTAEMSAADYRAAFSTLLVAKVPGVSGTRKQRIAVTELMQEVIRQDHGALANLPADDSTAPVYVTDESGRLVPRPYP